MSKGKIIIADNLHPYLIESLVRDGYECTIEPDITEGILCKRVEACVGIIVHSKMVVDQTLIDCGRKLKFIARGGSGIENVDTQYARSKGIICISTPEGNRVAVAEHVMGMLLALFNKIHKADREVRKFLWQRDENSGIELNGMVVGILGYGNTGSAFAKLLQGFDVTILAYDKYKQNYGNAYVTETSMEEIFKRGDILSLHIPLTQETKYLVNNEFIGNFKNNIYLINSSRGKIVDTIDLIKNIDSGKISGAVLDVLENENFSTYTEKENKWFGYLKGSDKIILSPHIAGKTEQSKLKIAKILYEKIKQIG